VLCLIWAYLHIADLVRLLQPRQRIALGGELLSDIAIVVGGGDGAADGGIVEFLRLVQFVAAGVAGNMEVADKIDAEPYGSDDISVRYQSPEHKSISLASQHTKKALGSQRLERSSTKPQAAALRCLDFAAGRRGGSANWPVVSISGTPGVR
jgi:hypothetical protein